MKTDFKHKGFTLIELLATMAIVILLAGVLIPAFNRVRLFARNTSQKAQLTTIDMAVMTFKNDYGSYPLSGQFEEDLLTGRPYNGAQKLAEALLGWDLLGFHPNSAWRSDGQVSGGGLPVYDATNLNLILRTANLNARKGPYIEPAKANPFRITQLFPASTFSGGYVLCDSFGAVRVPVGTGVVKAGAPILYYKANTTSKTMFTPSPYATTRIYNVLENMNILDLGKVGGSSRQHFDKDINANYDRGFMDFVGNPQISMFSGAWNYPYRADSYILISAGADGLYGTEDDITNFGN